MPPRYCEKTVVVVVPCAKAKSGIKAFWNTLSTKEEKCGQTLFTFHITFTNSCGGFFKDEL